MLFVLSRSSAGVSLSHQVFDKILRDGTTVGTVAAGSFDAVCRPTTGTSPLSLLLSYVLYGVLVQLSRRDLYEGRLKSTRPQHGGNL
jgi:hypothetical protein